MPELWRRLSDAYSGIIVLISPMQSYPPLNSLSQPQFEHFLADSGLAEFQKDELRQAGDKLGAYINMRFWQSYSIVEQKRFDFEHYYLTKGIFIRPELKTQVKQFADLMWDALMETKFNQQYAGQTTGKTDKADRLRKEGPGHHEGIAKAIEDRLWKPAEI